MYVCVCMYIDTYIKSIFLINLVVGTNYTIIHYKSRRVMCLRNSTHLS